MSTSPFKSRVERASGIYGAHMQGFYRGSAGGDCRAEAYINIQAEHQAYLAGYTTGQDALNKARRAAERLSREPTT